MIEEVTQHIEHHLGSGVIRPLKSTFTSNVVLLTKEWEITSIC